MFVKKSALFARFATLALTTTFVFAIGLTSAFAGSTTPTTAAKPSGIVREDLGHTEPANAPGQTLYLQRVTVAPGAKLAEHFHEGTQVARIVEGVLTYDIVSGAATITRAGGQSERFTGPKTIKLRRGDTIVETESLVHFGSNKTNRRVVIELATLLHDGAPLSTPAGTAATGTPLHLTTNLGSQDRKLTTIGPDGTRVYGWNHLVGTAMTADGKSVSVDMLGAVNYTKGSGPFSGFITFTFGNAVLSVTMQGITVASADTSNATFTATLGVIGGTGSYANATGSGTFVGTRSAALGTTVAATFDLRLTGVA